MKTQKDESPREYHGIYALLAGVSLVSACATESEIGTETYRDKGGDGPEWACGANAAIIDNTAVGEIDLEGQKGHGNFRILAFQHVTGVPLELDVQDGEFVGTDLLDIQYRGHALIGSRIILEDRRDLSLHVILINDFGYVDSWTQPVVQVPAYHLLAATLGVGLDPIEYNEVCRASVSTAGTPLALHHAVLIKGERHGPAARTATATGRSAARWFKLACNGSAFARTKHLGDDPALGTTAVRAQTIPAKRQATLKMLTADY